MLTRTSSTKTPCSSVTVPNFRVYPFEPAMFPFLQAIIPSAIDNASGPLTLITEIAPVPGIVAGAYIVSSFLMYIFLNLDPHDSLRSLRMTAPKRLRSFSDDIDCKNTIFYCVNRLKILIFAKIN